MRPNIYQSRSRGFFAGMAYGVCAILGFLALLFQYADGTAEILKHLMLALLIIVPGWIVAEYLIVFDNWEDDNAVRELKYGHKLASVIGFVILLRLLMDWW